MSDTVQRTPWADQLPDLLQAAWLTTLEPRRALRLLQQLAAEQRQGSQLTFHERLQRLADLAARDEPAAPPTGRPWPVPLSRWPTLTATDRAELVLLVLYGVVRPTQDRGAPAATALARLVPELSLNPAAECRAVRLALIVPSQALTRPQRTHLAECAACRGYAENWRRQAPLLEQALRAQLPPRRLLRAQTDLLRRALPPEAAAVLSGWQRWWPVVPVLLLLAVLILPSLRPVAREREVVRAVQTDIVERSAAELAASALQSLYRVPDEGAPLWYARYETVWYFDEQVEAPLVGEIWLDRDQPARHRLQLSHRDGGAPYELELGDGSDRLYYALDAAYTPALYGILTPQQAQGATLLAMALPAESQQQYLAARLASGPWQLPAAYLNQALQAADLRLLGRQSRNGRELQLLAFSGTSPLAVQEDAAAPLLTILLSVDLRDGRLIDVTELVGPSSGTRISRRIWRLEREEWLTGSERERAAFSIERAWTGLAEIPERATHLPLAPELPLLSATHAVEPAELLLDADFRPWLPGVPPAESQRAYLLWSAQAQQQGAPPQALIYVGAGRRLVLAYAAVPAAVTTPDGLRESRVTALRAGRLRSEISMTPAVTSSLLVSLTAETDGYGRDELRALTTALQPLDVTLAVAQDVLFAPQADRRARTIVLAALAEEPSTVLRRRQYRVRLAPRATAFPYAWQPAGGLSDTFFQQSKLSVDGTLVTRRVDATERERQTLAVEGPNAAWRWSAGQQVLVQFQPLAGRELQRVQLTVPQQAALELLSGPGGPLTAEATADGGLLAWRVVPAPVPESRQRLAELVPLPWLAERAGGSAAESWTLRVELEVDAAGSVRRIVYAHAPVAGMRLVLQEYEPISAVEPVVGSAVQAASWSLLRTILQQEPIRLLDRQRDGRLPTQPDLTRLALTLQQEPQFRYFLEGDAAVEAVLLGVDAGRATLGTLAYEALKREIGLASWYRLADAQGGAALVLLQAPADALGALLQSGGVMVRGQPLPVRTANGEEAWLVAVSGDGEQTLTVLSERDGTLLALSGPRALLEARAAELLAAIVTVP